MIRLLLLAILAIIIVSCSDEAKDTDSQSKKTPPPPPEPVVEYGFILDSFRVEIDTVRSNMTLSHMLLPHGINQADINVAYNLSQDSLVGLDYVTEGHRYTMLYPLGDTTRASHCIYEKNRIEYIVFSFNGTISVEKREHPVELRRREAAGTITSSLWNAFIDQGLSPEMVMRVVNTYQWSVDFFSIQPGDYYKIVFDEKLVGNEIVGSGDIFGIELHTYDSSFYAIPFEKDTIKGFFDKEGGSLRKAILKAPLDFIRISSHYNLNRLHPVLGYRRPHLGVDYAAPFGTPVVSVGDGTVIFAGWSGGAGNLIKVKHNDRLITYYMHLQRMNVRTGERVIQGQKIGEVGSTGLSTGPHLDYRIQINGKFVDPVHADIPTAEPLPEAILAEYKLHADSVINMLGKVHMEDVHVDTTARDTFHQEDHPIEH